MRIVAIPLLCAISLFAAGAFGQSSIHSNQHNFTSGQAEQIALRTYPGRTIDSVVLEDEEGHWQYAVMVRSGKTVREVMVGADSGKIEHVEVTTTEKEAAEHAVEEEAKKK